MYCYDNYDNYVKYVGGRDIYDLCILLSTVQFQIQG